MSGGGAMIVTIFAAIILIPILVVFTVPGINKSNRKRKKRTLYGDNSGKKYKDCG